VAQRLEPGRPAGGFPSQGNGFWQNVNGVIEAKVESDTITALLTAAPKAIARPS